MSSFLTKVAKCKVDRIKVIVQRGHSQQTQSKPLVRAVSSEVVPVFRKACNYTDRIAFRDTLGNYTYGNIFMGAKELSEEITQNTGRKNSERVLFLCPNDASYVLTQWAIWMSGQIAVPLSSQLPANMLEYYAEDSKAKLLVCTPEYAEIMQKVAKTTNKKLFVMDDKLRHNAMTKSPNVKIDMEAGLSPDFYNRGNAMILYTSGTTGNPKGVVLSHRNLTSQTTALLDAWHWSSTDNLLHCLPLNHVHGIVNALLCPLYVGARCVMLPRFDTTAVWSHLLNCVNVTTTVNNTSNNGGGGSGNTTNNTTNSGNVGNNNGGEQQQLQQPVGQRRAAPITVFMGVPTIYAKLAAEYERVFANDGKMTEYIRQTLKSKVRVMVSGSAPLPAPLSHRWLAISGHRLLERYGMTETGMVLSNRYEGERPAGHVGVPLPGVTVRLVNASGEVAMERDSVKEGVVTCHGETVEGELQVKGDSVFREYYNRPDDTSCSFTADLWFKTGDVAAYHPTTAGGGSFKLLGRTSVDIIKSGGHKISALEVETLLLAHEAIVECAVVGVADDVWGQQVAAIIVLKQKPDNKPSLSSDTSDSSDESVTLASLTEWAKSRMTSYQVPRLLRVVDVIPRNAMGKVNKKQLVKQLFGEGSEQQPMSQ